MRTTSLFKDYALLAGSGLFDVEYYRRGDPGLAAHVDPLMHYLEYGALERRDPGPDFVTVYYLEQCRALGETPGNPLLHYLTVGAARGLEPTPRAVASQDIQLAIDVPNLAEGTARVAAGATNFVVSGWALATDGIAGIQVVVDNAFAASAYYGIKRADVATAFPDNPDSLLAGFEAVIRCDGLDEGPHTVTVTARGKGEAVSRSVFVLDVPARPQGPPPNPIRARSSAAETWLCHRVLKGLDWSPRFLLILPITRPARRQKPPKVHFPYLVNAGNEPRYIERRAIDRFRRILLKKSKNRGRRKLAKLQSDGTLLLDAISVLLRTSHAA
jgi:hypothetical protein